MKKIYLLILIVLSVLFTHAQPVLTTYNSYSLISHSVINDESLPVGNAGENQNWDFSSFIIGSLVGNVNTVTVESAPGYEQFSLANFCQKFTSSSFVPPLENYTFYKITGSEREILGQTNGQGIVTIQYLDTQKLPLPLNYDDMYIDTYQTTTDVMPIVSNIKYDAYGTLTTPYGTYQNVIRIKTVNSNYTNYFWLQVTPNYLPLMDITSNSNIGTQVTLYEDVSNLSSERFYFNNQILIYPNPSANYINIRLPKNDIAEKIIITDLTGKKISEIIQHTNQINIENLNSGIYLIEAFFENNKYLSKFIKD